ncbi:ATP-binding protein [Streptomyces bottropensis]|uniref:ATP-binding protein n=1 Tax=Streptomyces bottropensis TaxID=42235 RepID=UPI0037A4C125
MRQVLGNLTSNALRRAALSPSPPVMTRPVSSPLRTQAAASPPMTSPNVFERFWRAEKSRSRRTGGSGMGLSIVRQFIEAHEGTVTVGGEPGKGCCSPSGSARAGTRTAAPHEVRRREARPTAAARDAAPPSADQ